MKRMQRSRRKSVAGPARRPSEVGGALFQQGLHAMRSGDFGSAETIYRRCTTANPALAEPYHHLGLIAARRAAYAEAATLIGRAVALQPKNAKAQIDLSLMFRHLGQPEKAIRAAELAVAAEPSCASHHMGLGLALMQHGELDGAAGAFGDATKRDPGSAAAFFSRAEALRRLDRLDEAAEACDRGLAIEPRNAEGLNARGLLRDKAGHSNQALEDFLAALRNKPGDAVICVNVAHIFLQQQNLDEAMRYVRQALAVEPANAAALGNLGTIYQRQGRVKEAIETYSEAIAKDPACIRHYTNLGALLIAIGQPDTAVASCRLAITMAPLDAEAHFNLAVALRQKGSILEAIEAYRLAYVRGSAEALVDICHLRQQICDWRGLAEEQAHAQETTYRLGRSVAPFSILTASTSPVDHRLCAEVHATTFPRVATPLAPYRREPGSVRRDRIRIGYLSCDFYEHATTSLIAQLLERQDRTRFELVGYSYGPDDKSEMRRRVIAAFDAFVDLRDFSHCDAARRIKADGVDILIDLKGYTQGARTAILAYRPAPIQVNYLGYPGTMGAPWVDYIVADGFVAPMEHAPHYSEKIVHLPHCYQPNDCLRPVAAEIGTRRDFSLPETGFVFCCFNNTYKITPEMFDLWMGLLQARPGAVLWLLEASEQVADNLRREARARGVAPERLVFAARVKADRHIARMALADLFLDTLPINAHTTASEALWVGLPVLTCAGEAFAGRVAGSLLRAVGLPELVTFSLEDYQAKALQLASHPDELARLRARLQATRAVAPLFDIDRYARDFDAVLERMWALREAGQQPEAFAVGETAAKPKVAPSTADRMSSAPFFASWAAEKDRYCVWIVSPDNYVHQQTFDEVAIGLTEGFAARGGSAPIVRDPAQFEGRIPIVLGPQLLSPDAASALPPDSVLFNMEQVDARSSWMNGHYLSLLKRHRVLDFSSRNAAALMAAGVRAARHLPIGYAPGLERVRKAETQDCDVLFYGSLNERRGAVLAALRARGLAVMHLFGVYGAQRDAAIGRAKLVLNMHFYDAAIFESVRVTYLLANRTCVVSEGHPDDPDAAPFAGGLALCPYEQLVERCAALVADEAEREALARRGYERITAYRQGDLLGDLFESAGPIREPAPVSFLPTVEERPPLPRRSILTTRHP